MIIHVTVDQANDLGCSLGQPYADVEQLLGPEREAEILDEHRPE